MFCRKRYLDAFSMQLAVVLPFALLIGCRNNVQNRDVEVQPAGEPDKYSATVVRIIDDGEKRETTISREVRSGEQRREEWTEGGHNRVLILRPAEGKGFLLDIDARTYMEIDIGVGGLRESQTIKNGLQKPVTAAEGVENQNSSVLGIDYYFEDTEPPTRRETVSLPEVTIDGHRCSVFEVRATYPDGHVETTRRFQAADLSGLLLRVESESDHSNVKLITERRNVSLDVNGDAFEIPIDFKKNETRSH
jgi:hypothetical protein